MEDWFLSWLLLYTGLGTLLCKVRFLAPWCMSRLPSGPRSEVSGLVRQKGAPSLGKGPLHISSLWFLTRMVGNTGIVIFSFHQETLQKEGSPNEWGGEPDKDCDFWTFYLENFKHMQKNNNELLLYSSPIFNRPTCDHSGFISPNPTACLSLLWSKSLKYKNTLKEHLTKCITPKINKSNPNIKYPVNIQIFLLVSIFFW